jgi:hypothetical protein
LHRSEKAQAFGTSLLLSPSRAGGVEICALGHPEVGAAHQLCDRPGVSGRCKLPEGGKFFTMSTHSHCNTTAASVSLLQSDRVTKELVSTTDWEHPVIAKWDVPFLIPSGTEELQYSCTYKNETGQVITVDESASENEM